MSRTAEWCWILLAFLLVNLLYASSQPINTFHEGLGDSRLGIDGRTYQSMAKNLPRELPPHGVAPFVYRLGTPLLVAGLAKSLDWVISAGFDRLDVACNALSAMLLALLLRRHSVTVFARLLVVVAFLVEPHSPVRFSYFHPLDVAPTVLAMLLTGLLAIEWFQSRPVPARAALVALLVAVGVAVHEVMLVVGVCALVCPVSAVAAGPGLRWSGWRDRWAALDHAGAWLPVVCGAAVLAAIHAWVVPTPSDYSASAEALRWLHEKSLLRYVVAWFLVFGPLLVLPIYFWRRSVRLLGDHPVWLAYLLMFGALAWLGGGDTERMLVFASPAVYVLIARALSWASVGPATVTTTGLVLLQALSSRAFSPIGGPIQPPQVLRTEVWERLGLAGTASLLSYENMWSQFCTPAVMRFYLLWYGLAGAAVIGVLWYQCRGSVSAPQSIVTNVMQRWAYTWDRVKRLVRRSQARVLIVTGTAAALAPVVWLALSRFYWSHYDQPGYGYLLYNLARLWTVVVLLGAFWATGSRITRYGAGPSDASAHWTDRFIESAFGGAAAWSVAVVLLAIVHLYYVWVVLHMVGVAVALAVSDLVAIRVDAHALTSSPPVAGGWGLVSVLLKGIVAITAAALLLTIALWGNPGPDNDVPGNYLPYYEAVLRAHSNAPNDYWVHFFVSKGNGLAFLLNILSDVQGASLASYLMVLLGALMIWRLAALSASVAPTIGLVGVCLYLQFYADQGAYAKGHIIRNTFLLYLILSFTRFICVPGRRLRLDALSRVLAIVAVIFLSPLAVVLLLPMLLMETSLIAVSRDSLDALRSLRYSAWALAATALVCLYNFFEVGLPELHSMPAIMGRVVNVERFGRWVDPRLAYLDARLEFLQGALSRTDPTLASTVTLSPTLSLARVLPETLNPAVMVLVGGSIVIAALGFALSRRAGATDSRSSGDEAPNISEVWGIGLVSAVVYLLAILLMLSVLRMFGGGEGSSMGRFTDFTTPLGIAIGVVLMTATRTLSMSRFFRGVLATAMVAVACVSMYLGVPSVVSQLWRPSVDFLIGRTTYAAMNDPNWETVTARRLAVSVPENAKVELLNFLPGFTAVPATPFQRPDGCAYLKDYTKVVFGSEAQAAAIYKASNIDYFLFDVADESELVWSALSPLFAPESIRSRMRLVTHQGSERRELYLLTWNRDDDPAGGEALDEFLRKWDDKLASQRMNGNSQWYERVSQRMNNR
jgi:hypothetical protein